MGIAVSSGVEGSSAAKTLAFLKKVTWQCNSIGRNPLPKGVVGSQEILRCEKVSRRNFLYRMMGPKAPRKEHSVVKFF